MSRIDPRDISAADVWRDGIRSARLTRHPHGVEFQYLPDYLSSGAAAVSRSLPLRPEPTVTSGGAVPPFFANLLPEGRRLTALRQAVKTSADDELSLLLALGADTVGNVQVLPQGFSPKDTPAEAATTASFAELDFAELLQRAGIDDPAALAGAQEKVSGQMLTIPLVHQGRGHLLKFDVPRFPQVVDNEAFFLGIARGLRIPVADTEKVYDRNGRQALLVTRFDREISPSGEMNRLAVEDAAQLLGIYPADKYNVSSEDVANTVGQVCAARPVALRAVFISILFAWLTGNGDLHAKNISVIERAGEWSVAPIYDIPSTVVYGDTTTALSIGGRRSGLSRRAFTTFGVEIGLPPRAVTSAIAHVLDVTEAVEVQIGNGAVPWNAQRRRDLVRTIRRRRRDMMSNDG